MNAGAGSQLCLACGMCCDGTLFTFVAISSEEARTLKAAGVEVRDEAGRLKLPQRCGALDGCKCTVYDRRPFVCRRFDCLLARSLKDKELPLPEALGIVAEARARLDRLEGLLPKPRAGEPSGAVLRAATLAQSGTRVSDAARGAFDEAQEYLRRHFVPD
jgi:uncharacterized protein